jgi:hypothetical protein
MIKLIELNHTLTKVGAAALDLTSRTSPLRSRDLCQVLRAALWILAGDIEGVDTPTRREACRQLHIETTALLAEIELALRQSTSANFSGVRHRARVWNELLENVRPTLGIRLAALERHGLGALERRGFALLERRGPLAGQPASADRPPVPPRSPFRSGGFLT